MKKGTKLHGKWTVGEVIQSGGQGTVHFVTDDKGKKYAIKVVRVKDFQKKKLERIKREVQIIKQLKGSLNIIEIYDDNIDELKVAEESTQEAWYIMDYARHGSLKDNDFYINDIESSLVLFKGILEGVDRAHKAEVIHRDLKPANILLYPNQKSALVTDFGLGLLKEFAEEKLTDTDEILGPANFMAPEQYKNPSKADQRSDIYSLGKILYFMLTGKMTRSEVKDLAKDFQGSNPYLPLLQDKLLGKMTSDDPAKRHSTIDEVIEDVDSILQTITSNSHRMVKKDTGSFSIYDFVVVSQREEFIKGFSKDLEINMRLLEMAADELIRDNKKPTLKKLKEELFAKYGQGKIKDAIQTTFIYVENPEELKKHEKSSRYSFSSYYMAKYFYNANSYQLAHEHLIGALDKEKDSGLKLRYLLLFAAICKKCTCSKPHDFEKRIKDLLRSISASDEKAELYEILGSHYIEVGEKALGLRFLEAYLIIRPYDTKVRFKCAYQYSEIDQEALAFYHYIVHKKTQKEISETVDNNLGVIYSNKGMHIKAMQSYDLASKEGSTLAGSNIASKYLQIGLVKEAQDILRSIIRDNQDGNYDQRVDNVLGQTAQNRLDEDEKEEKLEKEGALLNEHNAKSIESLPSDAYSWAGFWEIDAGPVIKIEQRGSSIDAKKHNTDNEGTDIKFEGNSATVSKLVIGSTTYKFGVLYLVNENEFHGYITSYSEVKEIIGSRIPDIKKYDDEHTSAIDRLLNQMHGYDKPSA